MDRGTKSPGKGLGFDTVRKRNLATILRHVHYSGGITRSDIARLTGLYSSTVISLATELQDRGLVVEKLPEQNQSRGKGRPSALLLPNPKVAALVCHVGLREMTCAIVALGGNILHRLQVDLPKIPTVEEVRNHLTTFIQSARQAMPFRPKLFQGVIAISALVSLDGSAISAAPSFGWQDVDMHRDFASHLGFNFLAVPDAIACGIAELRFGVAKDWQDVLYLHGTDDGVSCGIFVKGSPLRGAQGFSGQFGASPVAPPTGTAGRILSRTVDDEINRRAAVRACGVDDYTDEQIESAMYEGEPTELRNLARRQAEVLSQAISTAVNLLNPQAIVFNGYAATVFGADPGYLTTLVRRQCLTPMAEGLTLVRSSLGADAVLIGAGEEAFKHLLTEVEFSAA